MAFTDNKTNLYVNAATGNNLYGGSSDTLVTTLSNVNGTLVGGTSYTLENMDTGGWGNTNLDDFICYDTAGNIEFAKVTAIPHTSITYNGTNEFADVDTPFNQFSAGTRYATIAMWFWPDSTRVAGDLVLFQQRDSSNANWLEIAIGTTELLHIYARGPGADSYEHLFNQGPAIEDQWNQLIVQIDSTNDTVNAWLNGSQITIEEALSGSISIFNDSDIPINQRFGGNVGGTQDFEGRTRMMGIAGGNTKMTNEEALSYRYDPETHLSNWGYQAYWYGDEGSGTTVDNEEGDSDHDLTLTAGTQWNVPDADVITVDAAPSGGLTDLTSVNVNIGGAYATIDFPCNMVESTNWLNGAGDPITIWVKNGSYNELATIDNAGTALLPITLEGYNTDEGDGWDYDWTGNLPTMDGGGSNDYGIRSNVSADNFWVLRHFYVLDSTGVALVDNTSVNSVIIAHCKLADNGGWGIVVNDNCIIYSCDISGHGFDAIDCDNNNYIVTNEIYSNGGGVTILRGSIVGNHFYDNSSNNVTKILSPVLCAYNTIDGNYDGGKVTTDGVQDNHAAPIMIAAFNIIHNCNVAFRMSATATAMHASFYNQWDNNNSANVNWIPGQGDVEDGAGAPGFTDEANNNYQPTAISPANGAAGPVSFITKTGITYNGVNQFADVNTPFNQFSAGTRYATIAMNFWLDSTRPAANNRLFHQRFSGAEDWAYVNVDITEAIDVRVRGAAGDANFSELADQGTALENSWNQLIVQIDSTDNTVDIWLNGTQVTTAGNLSHAISAFDNSDVPSGQRWGNYLDGSAPFKGRLRMMGIAGGNVALTADDAALYSNNPYAHLSTWGYAAWWKGDEGTGTTVDNDEGTASRDLTLTDADQWNIERVTTNTNRAVGAAESVNKPIVIQSHRKVR
jgi:hypothetical protein